MSQGCHRNIIGQVFRTLGVGHIVRAVVDAVDLRHRFDAWPVEVLADLSALSRSVGESVELHEAKRGLGMINL